MVSIPELILVSCCEGIGACRDLEETAALLTPAIPRCSGHRERSIKFPCSPADPFFVGRLFSHIAYSVCLPLACAAASLAWESAEDNKPPAELQAMDESMLAWEAQGPCIKAAITALVVTSETIARRKEALRYLGTIIAVARKKDGKVPPWLYELVTQADSASLQGCTEVAKRVYLSSETSSPGQATPDQPAGTPTSSKK